MFLWVGSYARVPGGMGECGLKFGLCAIHRALCPAWGCICLKRGIFFYHIQCIIWAGSSLRSVKRWGGYCNNLCKDNSYGGEKEKWVQDISGGRADRTY